MSRSKAWKLSLISFLLVSILLASFPFIGANAQEEKTLTLQTIVPCGGPSSGWQDWFPGNPCCVHIEPVYEGLVDQRLDEEDNEWKLVNTGLAKDWQSSEDMKTWTFQLREGVEWHDGEKFDAHDVKYTFDMYLHPEVLGIRSRKISDALVGMEDYEEGKTDTIEGVRVVDDYTVEFNLKYPMPEFDFFVHYIPIVPRHRFIDIPMEDIKDHEKWSHPVGTGPFEFERYKEEEFYVDKANENYWGGEPNIDRIVAYWDKNPDNIISRLEAGELDVAGLEGRQIGVSKAESIESITEGTSYNKKVTKGVYGTILFTQPRNENITQPVRRAISYAIDREAFTNILPYVEPWSHWGQGRGHTPTVESPTYDPEKARSILEEINFEQEETWTLVTSYTNSAFRSAVTALSEMLGEVGIETETEVVESATSNRYFMDGDEFDLFFDGAPFHPPLKWTEMVTQANLYPKGENPGYDMPAVETLEEEYVKLDWDKQPEEKQALMEGAHAIMHHQSNIIPVFLRQQVYITSDNFDSGDASLAQHGYWPFRDWGFEEWDLVEE